MDTGRDRLRRLGFILKGVVMRRKLAVVLAAAIVFVQLPQAATAAYADEIGGVELN